MRSTCSPFRIPASAGAILLAAGALSLAAAPARAQGATERMTDRDVKTLIEQVDEGRDKFEGNLEGQFKSSTVRGSSGEIKVSNALQDYQDSTKKLKDRFKEDYSAGAEVATVLKQGSRVHAFMQGQSSVMKGRKEWDSEAASLTHLATAYGTTFPTPPDATARRMNDKELAGVAATMASAAENVRDEIDASKTLPQPEKDAAKQNVEALIKQAKLVRDHTGEGKPSTTEVRQLAEHVSHCQQFVNAHPTPTSSMNWRTVQTSLLTLQQAYHL
jgi:hypothetical protein